MKGFNVRAHPTPFTKFPDLSFEVEYVMDDNGALISSTAWNARVAYQFGGGGKG